MARKPPDLDGLRRALLGAALAHELKQPLNALNLNIELICRRVGVPAADVAGPLASLQRAADRLELTIDAFANLTRPPAAPDEVGDIAGALSAMCAGLPVALSVADGLPRCAFSPEQLQLALTALVDNARRASKAKGAVMVRASASDDGVVVAVVDAGVGMTAEVARRAPEMGFSTWKRPGIGLTVAKLVAYNHAGSFKIESVDGRGTTVSLTFPTDV